VREGAFAYIGIELLIEYLLVQVIKKPSDIQLQIVAVRIRAHPSCDAFDGLVGTFVFAIVIDIIDQLLLVHRFDGIDEEMMDDPVSEISSKHFAHLGRRGEKADGGAGLIASVLECMGQIPQVFEEIVLESQSIDCVAFVFAA